jgi:hypothetical protein
MEVDMKRKIPETIIASPDDPEVNQWIKDVEEQMMLEVLASSEEEPCDDDSLAREEKKRDADQVASKRTKSRR